LAGALFFDEKISQSAPLFWFRLRAVRILKIFTRKPACKEQLLTLPQFGRMNPSVEEIGGLDGFL
jgi:hypothetical protein